jgi:hypothetical protein
LIYELPLAVGANITTATIFAPTAKGNSYIKDKPN